MRMDEVAGLVLALGHCEAWQVVAVVVPEHRSLPQQGQAPEGSLRELTNARP